MTDPTLNAGNLRPLAELVQAEHEWGYRDLLGAFVQDLTPFALAEQVMRFCEPEFVCLEGMSVGELAAYDYGCACMQAALQAILDGKDTGEGVANHPWQGLRQRVLAVMRECENLRAQLR